MNRLLAQSVLSIKNLSNQLNEGNVRFSMICCNFAPKLEIKSKVRIWQLTEHSR